MGSITQLENLTETINNYYKRKFSIDDDFATSNKSIKRNQRPNW